MATDSPTPNKNPHPDFDGHLEQDVTKMNPKEKLLYMSRQIRLRHFIKTKVKKVPKEDK